MRFFRTLLISAAAVLLATLGLSAADSLSGSAPGLVAQLISGPKEPCPAGMVFTPTGQTFSCADQFEASAGAECPVHDPESSLDTKRNIENKACQAVSAAGAAPWRFVSREEAARLCARAGKRLPSALEWYQMALDTPETKCNTDSQSYSAAGEYVECQSAMGAFDLVGNVWEWVNDDVIGGRWNDRTLPASGYVAAVDRSGVATLTSEADDDNFTDDYFWSQSSGTFGLMRGGYYGSRNDGGLFAIHADTDPNFAGTAVGFRCVN